MALGNIGLRYGDFCALTPDEFARIYRAYGERQEAQYKDNWERMRMLAAITIQPYARKGLTPHSLLPFPWDAESRPARRAAAERVGKEDALRRFEEVLKKAHAN